MSQDELSGSNRLVGLGLDFSDQEALEETLKTVYGLRRFKMLFSNEHKIFVLPKEGAANPLPVDDKEMTALLVNAIGRTAIRGFMNTVLKQLANTQVACTVDVKDTRRFNAWKTGADATQHAFVQTLQQMVAQLQ